MALVNVNRKNTDQFYRYKMPKLIAKVEGKGNGIKTVIVNMVDIAKALSRPPSYPTKFFGCELGAQTQIDLKNERYIVNGSHNADKLQEILDSFIEKFVLCPGCENPETNLAVHKGERISQDCIACGHHGIINMQHRLITYIVKNPPGVDSTGTPSKKDKKEKRKEKQNRKHNGETSPTHNTANHSNGTKFESPTAKDEFDDDWCVDTSEEAVQKRMDDLSSGVKGLAMSDDLERSQEDRFNIFYRFVENKKKSGEIDGSDKELVVEAERLDIKDKAILALAEVLFNENILQQIPRYRIVLLRFVNNNHKAQRYLLGAYEMLVGKSFPNQLLPKSAHILKAMYDNDLVEEEIILNWAEKVSKKYVSKETASQIHEKAAPFVKWLKEAEEEESSDEEEDDVEIEYNTKAAQLKVESTQREEDDGDDVDIDAI